MKTIHSKYVLFGFLILLSIARLTSQNTRHKRQIQPEMPRIMTQDGHLVFQSGTNHNITFRVTNGGFINVGGDNLAVISQTVKDNKLAIDQLRTVPTASSGIESRLTSIEGRLNNLQPTGQVQTSLLTLGHRIDLINAQTPPNTATRLSTLEASLANLQATGEVQTLINQLTTRMTAVEGQMANTAGSDDLVAMTERRSSMRRVSRRTTVLRRKVRQLETRMNNIQNMLTTNECDSNPCRNGGTCVDSYNGFSCRCPSNYQGITCEQDVNECAIYAGTDLGCQNGATCTNTPGSFTCQCASNWHGVRCTERHDDCTGASSSQLCGHGTCVNQDRVQPGQPKYTCICDQGWTSSGSDPACTIDVDECSDGRPHCSVNPQVSCINLPGSFQCGPCPAGYNGNGFVCTDVNECAVNNGGCSMSPMVQCINTIGARSCGPCPPGYQGDGVTCNWVGVCQSNNGGCHPQAACTESPGFEGRSCTCAPGYVGNGVGATGCTAQGAVTGACTSNPCLNGAVCQATTASYRCVCQPGYTDQNCQTNINECESNPCQNGGSCSDQVNGYSCQCTQDYTGANCEIEQQVCGGSLTGETGTFSYPSIPNTQYPHGVSCAWRITTTYGKILMVTFPSFNLESHVNCAYDFLQINDGPTAASYTIGRYCGSSTPNNGQPINSTHHQLYFWFKSDTSVASDGFTVQWRSADPVCGGNLAEAEHGEFSSPGYPGNYPHDRDCVWTITVAPGYMILFTFATLAIETHPDCNYDYLEIRDGGLDTSPLLNRYCNTTSPSPLQTTGPTAWVKFHTDSSMSDIGFHITYVAVQADAGCGGVFTDETGILISPNYPNAYNHDASCVWIITVQERDTLALTFTNLDLEGSATCQYDYIEVRDGNNENAALLARVCGSVIPVPLQSSSNSLYVKFVSDSSVTHAGFRATWSVACGGTFTDPTGVIRSPYFPQPYPSNRRCEYMINVPEGSRVTLTFSAFDVEASVGDSDCRYDYLEIRDGGSALSPILNTFCGPQVPSPVTTSTNMMYLLFVTDGSVQNQGFEAAYETSDGCGEVLTDPTGSIQSPGHPNSYPHGVNCTWQIQVQDGLVVRLTFNTFSIESHANCMYDSVAVYDGPSKSPENLIGRYCSQTIPPVATSTNNVMLVEFISDASVSFEGFTASYVALNASTLCGRHYTDTVGMITSPDYPNNYPHQRECVWTITAPDGNQILLNVTDFNLENHPNCNYDYLEIRNGGFATSPLVGRYCGTTIDNIIVSHSNRMYIKLVTDSSMSAPGFKLIYDATATGCGSDLTTSSGSFVSPNYPQPYGHGAECFWTITVARGSRIQLAFVDLDLELNANCIYDYIEVRETDANGALLGKFCGNTLPEPITSTTNRMFIKYRTDYSVAGRGFHVFYSSVCGGTLGGFHGVIESPNFPDPYPHNRNCTWTVEATLGNTVNASFSHFDIESHSNCQYDYLQVRDGNSGNSDIIGTYCGRNLPPPIASSQQYLWLKFMSDYSVAMNGFRMEYFVDGCGGYLNTPTGAFTSPNYPNPYPHRRVCEWTITAPTGSYIQLTIETFDLESHSSCAFDVLEIYAGRDDSSNRIAQLCHTQTSSQTLSTTGNMMFVRFKSDISISGNGFSATYKTMTGGCGGNFTTPSGSIASKNFPNNYPHDTDCSWLITVDELHNVVLNFTNFDVEGAADCAYDYVAVYDGPSESFPEMLKFCGSSLPSPTIYRSRSNTMYIRMRTDSSVSGTGFKADYVTGCGGVVNAEQDGVIISSGYPNNYPYLSNCSWLITTDHSSDRITLTFTHMDLESSVNCSHDYIKVYDGNDNEAPLIGTYCGQSVPVAIVSQGSTLYVQFITDRSIQSSGFSATYSKSTSACGGDFTALSGAFVSPGYPNFYPTNTECVWTVSVSPGNRVQLSFPVFNLEDHINCNNDYVEIHEGQLGGPLLGRFCGNTIPSNLTAYNGVWIKFRSDESSSARGFSAQYASLPGGEISGTSGQVGSPMYPSQYPHNVDYRWTITVPIDMRVRITFTTLDMENTFGSTCRFDFLKIRDGGSIESPVIGSFCGTNLPDPLVSSSNQVHIEFHSDWSSAGQGFLLSWQATSDYPMTTILPGLGTSPVPGCGGTLNVTDDPQTLTSPGYPSGYLNNLNCLWILNTPIGSLVWINITDIDLEGHNSCNYDKLTVYDSLLGNGLSLGQFCGRTGNVNPLQSTQNGLSIRFETDFSVNRTGFSLQYKAECGGLIRASSGVIKSPRYPNNYPANSNCTWTVAVPTGRTLRLQFTAFNIQGTQGSCSGDYVQLLNGFFSSSPPLGEDANGRYCGNNPPAILETSSNYLNMMFLSDGSGSGPGFSLSFSEVQITCGGQLRLDTTTTNGVFTSPNYPSNYPQNVDCIWVIVADPHHRIQIDFQDTFAIESHSQCNYDYIQLRDGGTVNSPELGSFCGYTLPSTVLSSGNVMFARFRTDSSVARQGFKAQYKIATCGGRYNGNSGVITSPNYPNNYDNDLDCTWLLTGPTGHFFTLTFTAFAMESAANCSTADYVEIREINATGPVLYRGCGSNTPQAVSTSDSYAYIRFVSNGRNQYTGFQLNFEASVEECGGVLATNSGSFTSPNFPNSYPHSRICEWLITVQPGKRITITFNPFNIEDHSRCLYDYVQVYNGGYSTSPIIGRYCGDVPPTTVETSGNKARVRFRTDGSITNGGFQAFYTSDQQASCGGIIPSSSGNLTSPGYGSGNYTNNEECVWQIMNMRPINSSIVVRFNDLQLEHATSCNYDWLEFREGDSIDGVLLDRFCGNNSLPAPLISPTPSLWVRFRTDSSIVDRGFHLSYNISQCGGVLTNPGGTITSPNYPQNYDHNDACAWQILAPEGTRISITFNDFNMESHPNCNYDYLELFNGPYASSPSIGRFCGTTSPSTFISQTNSVRIVLFTDFSMAARGFSLSYAFGTQGCGGLYHSQIGNLSTPNYPSSYPHNAECVWDINVERGYIVNLTFLPPFDLEAQSSCMYDYLEVSDGLSNGTLVPLGRWCQNVLPPPQMSSGHRLVVKFRSDATTNGNGFAAQWTTSCGGMITTFPGILHSPGYPGNYDNNLRCNYTIVTDPQHYIVVDFDPISFNIEAGFNCNYDVLALYNGNSSSSPSLGRFCGQVAPQRLSALGSMHIQFWTDGSIVSTGWRLAYRVSECGGEFTSPSGVIETPSETDYHNNQNCTWHITTEPNTIIDLKFSRLDIEAHSSCIYDYIDVFDGPSINSPKIGRFCGDSIPANLLRSTSNTMTINLVTDYSVVSSGFRAVYRATYGPAVGCGGILNSTTSGTLRSLDIDGDGQYENDLDCHWLIIGGNNKVIKLTVQNIDIEDNENCVYDYLKVYDGIGNRDPLIGTFCGSNIPPIITSLSNALFVQFYTDMSITGLGFNATYVQEDALCGGALTSTDSAQIITSPGYPNAFRQNIQCLWTIDAPSDRDNVMIQVTALNLQTTTTCSPEYLEIRDYPLGPQGRGIHVCGVTTPTVFFSFGRTVQIQYAATSGGSTGFSLTYKTAGCSRNFTGNFGQIFSPGWPGGYYRNLNCDINIIADEGRTISLYFNTFHIEFHQSCTYDYLELRNGSSTAEVIRRICGQVVPDPIFATTNQVFMKLVTDHSLQYPGYDITYTATDQGVGCGGTVNGINGSFTSPAYPGNYTEAKTCTWTVQVPSRRVITLTFADIQIFGPESCNTDYMELFDGNSDLTNPFGRYCGGEVPASLTTSGNVAFVKYVSSGNGNSIRFRLLFAS